MLMIVKKRSSSKKKIDDKQRRGENKRDSSKRRLKQRGEPVKQRDSHTPCKLRCLVGPRLTMPRLWLTVVRMASLCILSLIGIGRLLLVGYFVLLHAKFIWRPGCIPVQVKTLATLYCIPWQHVKF